jgi:hypothetical protein
MAKATPPDSQPLKGLRDICKYGCGAGLQRAARRLSQPSKGLRDIWWAVLQCARIAIRPIELRISEQSDIAGRLRQSHARRSRYGAIDTDDGTNRNCEGIFRLAH